MGWAQEMPACAGMTGRGMTGLKPESNLPNHHPSAGWGLSCRYSTAGDKASLPQKGFTIAMMTMIAAAIPGTSFRMRSALPESERCPALSLRA